MKFIRRIKNETLFHFKMKAKEICCRSRQMVAVKTLLYGLSLVYTPPKLHTVIHGGIVRYDLMSRVEMDVCIYNLIGLPYLCFSKILYQ